jgi:hypothetical protein
MFGKIKWTSGLEFMKPPVIRLLPTFGKRRQAGRQTHVAGPVKFPSLILERQEFLIIWILALF